jgi:hypothetical protein
MREQGFYKWNFKEYGQSYAHKPEENTRWTWNFSLQEAIR